MFSYTIAKQADREAFIRTCALIETKINGIEKMPILEDVDGTQIQIYNTSDGRIKVVNDYEVDAVYIESDIDRGGDIWTT